jgi:hypothetical protein
MYQRIIPRWKAKLAKVKALIPQKEAELELRVEEGQREVTAKELAWLRGQLRLAEQAALRAGDATGK